MHIYIRTYIQIFIFPNCDCVCLRMPDSAYIWSCSYVAEETYAGRSLATTRPWLSFSLCRFLWDVSKQQQNIELAGTLCWHGSDRLLRWCQQLFGRVSGRAWRSFAKGQRDLGLGATRSRSTWTVRFSWRLYHPRALIGLAYCTMIWKCVKR